MNLQYYSVDVTDLTKNANIVKEALLGILERDGLLTKPAAEIAGNYAIVVSKPGWFGKLWKKLKQDGDDANELRYDVVKHI